MDAAVVTALAGAAATVVAAWLTYRARARTSALSEWARLVTEMRAECDRLRALLDECHERVDQLRKR